MTFHRIFAANLLAIALSTSAGAQVERVDLDIAGYLCGF